MNQIALRRSATVGSQDIMTVWLSNRSPNTIRAYQKDLRLFCDWAGITTLQFLPELASLEHAQGVALLVAYREHMIDTALAPSTINRRLTTLRSLLRLGHDMGALKTQIGAPNVKAGSVRDNRGPDAESYAELVASVTDPRDHCMIRLMHDLALRRAELTALDLKDFHYESRTLWVLRKGHTTKVPLTIPHTTLDAIMRHVEHRGREPGALFQSSRGRLTGTSVARMLKERATEAGLEGRWNPHGLRHRGITRAAELTGGNIPAIAAFSGHKDYRTVQRYVDDAEDLQAGVAEQVAAQT